MAAEIDRGYEWAMQDAAEQAAQDSERLSNETIQAITGAVAGFQIEAIDGDNIAPKGYYQFRVSVANGTDITGTPFQSAVNALQDFLDYACDVVRDADEMNRF